MISLLDVEYRNLHTVRHAKIPLNNQGVVLVVGENGSGKSTLFSDGLYYGLYGRSLRYGDNPGDAVIGRDGNEMFVKINLDNNGEEFTVVRARGSKTYPNGLSLFDSAGKQMSLRRSKDTQEVLNTILGRDANSFRVSTLFSESAHFQALEPEKQRKILDDMLDISVVNAALISSKRKLEGLSAAAETADRSVVSFSSQLSTLREEKDAAVVAAEQWEKNHQSEFDAWDLEDRAVSAEIEKLEKQIVNLTDQRNRLELEDSAVETHNDGVAVDRRAVDDKLDLNQRRYNRIYGEAERIAAALEGKPKDTCPSCKQKLPASEVAAAKAHLEAEADGMINELTALKPVIDELKKSRKQLVFKEPKHATEIKQLTRSISEAGADVSALIRARKPSPASINPHKDTVARLESSVSVREEKLTAATKTRDESTADIGAEETLIELFGPNGCRQVVTQRAIPFLNSEAARVKSVMETNISTRFEYRNGGLEVVLNHPTGASVYKGGSKGERNRVDMIAMFCLLGLVRRKGASAFKQVFFDEAFDGLDYVGIQGVTKAIRSLQQDVFVISHIPDMMPADKVWTVDNGEISFA